MPAGAGGNDSRGVYLFGESDTDTLFSDMLNRAGLSISTQLGVDRGRLTALETAAPFPAASAAARDTHWGTPATAAARRALQTLGAITIRLDLGVIEQYFANLTDGGANPGGRTTAGWYPIIGKWTSVVPALTNVTIGTATQINTQEWRYEGEMIHVVGRIRLGTSGALGGDPTIATPVALVAPTFSGEQLAGSAMFIDASPVNRYPGVVTYDGTNVSTIRFLRAVEPMAPLNVSAPFPTWAVGDGIKYEFWGRPA